MATCTRPKRSRPLNSWARFNEEQKAIMEKRTQRRKRRYESGERITFLDPDSLIPRTNIKVQDARDGKFEGAEIPHDLKRQWIQGTGPAAKPNSPVEKKHKKRLPTLFSRAPTGGCSTERTPSDKYPLCPLTTSETSSSPSRETRFS